MHANALFIHTHRDQQSHLTSPIRPEGFFPLKQEFPLQSGWCVDEGKPAGGAPCTDLSVYALFFFFFFFFIQKTEEDPWSFTSPWTCYLFNLQLLHFKTNDISGTKWSVSATLYKRLKKPYGEAETVQCFRKAPSLPKRKSVPWFPVNLHRAVGSQKWQECFYSAEWAETIILTGKRHTSPQFIPGFQF